MKNKTCEFKMEKVTIKDAEDLLSSCKDRPPGVDYLDAKFLRMVANVIAVPVCHIINLSIEKGICPQAWKISKMIPLRKKTSAPFSGTNCQPISLLPALAKVMERIIFKQIQSYFDIDYQHAYMPGDSTCTALTQMMDDWHRDIDKGRLVGAVLLDFSAAFDVIDHVLLLHKLEQYGCGEIALMWLKSYLTDRRQSVFFNGSLSRVSYMNCGVPRGSRLGPLLFSIFTNELPLVLVKAKMANYADDSTIYASESSIQNLNHALEKELQSVMEWVTQNKLVLKTLLGKTKAILMGTKYRLKDRPVLVLKMNNTPIEQGQERKLLGVTFNDVLAWTKYIDNTVCKMGRAVSIVRRISGGLPTDVITQVVDAIVISQLDDYM